MTDFTVAHIGIARQADRGAVSFDLGVRAIGQQPVQSRGIRLFYGIAFRVFSETNAIHYDKNKRFFHCSLTNWLIDSRNPQLYILL